MRNLLLVTLAVCLQAASAAAAPTRPNRVGTAEAEPAAAHAKPAAAQDAGRAADGDSQSLCAFGLVLERRGESLSVLQALPRSAASDLGIRPGDAILSLQGSRTPDPAKAARALRGLKAGDRLWALVRRGLKILPLDAQAPSPPESARSAGRSPQDLSLLELELRKARLEEAGNAARRKIAAAKIPKFRIDAGQTFWIRFPGGIRADAAAGTIVEGITATGLTTDFNLDFMAVPPRSAVWAKVLSNERKAGVSKLKLFIYKIRLNGGHAYPLSARLSDVSGDHLLTRVTPGGTFVAADPASSSFGKQPPLVDPDIRLQIQLLEPWTLSEGPTFFRAGPGLWFRTKEGKERTFEVTKVVPRRSAERAGVRPGDLITGIAGASTSGLRFHEALDKLYGPQGTSAELRVRRGSSSKAEALSLARGVSYEDGLGFNVRRSGGALEVSEVWPDSPAGRAGLKVGDRLTRWGSRKADKLSAEEIASLLKGPLRKGSPLYVRRAGERTSRAFAFDAGVAVVPLAPPYER